MYKHMPMVAHADLEGRVKSLEDNGYVYLPKVIDTDEVAELRDRLDQLEPIPESNDYWGDPGDSDGLGEKSIHVKNAFNRDKAFFRLLDKPGVIEVAEAALGDDCHIIGMSGWKSGPGRPDQSLHSDWVSVPLPADIAADPRVRLPIFISTAHFYLNDTTEELGPTRMIPGSHRAGRPPEPADTAWNGVEQQSVMVDAGDVVMFRSEIWHRGSANTGIETRYLVQVHYSSRWISPRMPPYMNKLKFDEALLAQATSRQLRLLGDHPIRGLYT